MNVCRSSLGSASTSRSSLLTGVVDQLTVYQGHGAIHGVRCTVTQRTTDGSDLLVLLLGHDIG